MHPLAGRYVAILRDEDGDGASYAATVTAILQLLMPPAHPRIIELPGLSEGDDIEQWIAGRRALGIANTAILAELHLLVSACA